MIYRNIQAIFEKGYFITSGLSRYNSKEIKLLIKTRGEEEYLSTLAYLIDYIIDFNPQIQNNQTIAFHSWVLKFVLDEDSYFCLYEFINSTDSFEEGVDNAIRIVNQQENECLVHGAIAIFPLFSQKIAISKGVEEGLDVEGVRYSAPEHMTGWYITTDLYDENIQSLIVVYYYELALKRPDLTKYLALPFGYRFNSGVNEIVWFDKDIQ